MNALPSRRTTPVCGALSASLEVSLCAPQAEDLRAHSLPPARRFTIAESKAQKVARQGALRQAVGTCECGGQLIWTQVILRPPRMMTVCERCGAQVPRSC